MADTLFNYEIAFTSNFENELGNVLSLNYKIVSGKDIIAEESIPLIDGNTDAKQILNDTLLTSEILTEVIGKLPAEFKFVKFYYANKGISDKYPKDYTKWNEINQLAKIPASELKSGGVAVAAILEKKLQVAIPMVKITDSQFDFPIKDSDDEKEINIKFTSTNCDFVDIYLSESKTIRVDSVKGFINLFFKKDFNGIYGRKKIYLVPVSNLYGTGERIEILINFISINDFPSITEIVYATKVDIPSFSDSNIDCEIKYTTFSSTGINVDLVLKDNSKISLFKNLTPNGSFKINLKELGIKYSGWVGSKDLSLVLKPYNTIGKIALTGNEYTTKTELFYSPLKLDEDILKKSIYDAFIENIKFTEIEKESKYLTHLANFGNDEQILISSWEADNYTLSDKIEDELGNTVIKNEVKSLILKLYQPLPANVTENSTFWITRLMTNPLIETIILNQQDDIKCPPLKGPNFSIEVDYVKGQSTNYESLDNLILSGSTTSTELVATYLSSSLIDTSDLNIEYSSGSTYLWDNFVHFSSAGERVDNFVYKVQLIENYDKLINSASVISDYNNSLSAIQELERQNIKKEQLIQSFDGFEKFLYTSSSLSWPYDGINRKLSISTEVEDWYNSLILLAEDYDIENSNYVLNNIPQYIVTNENNDQFRLFFTMIGQHFDSVYFHTKSIERSRGLGYKAKGGISDKILFDALKSFSWDAKNLDADSKLWSYVFGNQNGETELNPAKQRTNEVWRRIINNLPYLLKHKGTRRGIYALLSCYGIPSSNLSILEFGGPEVSETSKTKLIYDNITTALKMNLSSSFEMEWGMTNLAVTPNTVEFFIKPAESSNYRLITGNGWDVSLSSSVSDSNFGYVSLNYNTTGSLTTSLLPIFNGQFFGVAVSKGTNGLRLDVRQSNKERTIFEESISASVTSNWENTGSLKFGGNYSGSIDEFRLWSSQLDTQRFYEHVSFPEMVNGNSISGSTDELHFRLDFEYPKNLALTSSLINVDSNIYYGEKLNRNILEETGSIVFGTDIKSTNVNAIYTASASGFDSLLTTYPYHFEVIDRSVVLEIPDMGSTRYSTNKVRFESQTDFNGNDVSGGIDLSIKSRSTKKAFDQSPTDSNRVGLFFSPTKELNIDIAKSFGGINLDNYIGDPSDVYKSNYKSLDNLRNYYFQRFNGRDIYAYINLIKLYEKSMFEDIKKMLPARVKATTGLLIEPHILERSKIAKKKPTGDEYQQETTIHYEDTTILTSNNNQLETLVNADFSENVFGENNQLETTIYTASVETVLAESYQKTTTIPASDTTLINAESIQQYVTINAGLDLPTIVSEINLGIETYGQSAYETIGFGIYAQSGSAIRTYFDKDNKIIKERIRVQLITEQKERMVTKFAVTASANGLGDPRGGYISDIQTYTETKLNIQPFSGSIVPNVGGDIISVQPVNGYLPTHYRNTSDLTTGMQNSYYKGCKNTSATTLDGSSPIETFTTNPNTLRVNKAGRDISEPILEVE